MYRFRKKSDASYNQAQPVTTLRSPVPHPPSLSQALPSLPPESDFRTSLILPDLTKRFTLLRTSSGNLVPLDDLRSRFAEKRALALETAISEEEEDMLVEALSRMRNQNPKGVKNVDEANTNLRSSPSSASYSVSDNGHSSIRQSSQSSATMSSSNAGHEALDSSPGSRASKRHSNNMFGSGQFRDFRYMRRATNKSSVRSINSLASSISTSRSGLSGTTGSYQTLDESLHSGSVTPDQHNLPHGFTSNSTEHISTIQPIAMAISSEDVQPNADLQLSKPLGRAQLQRLSTSLEEVIREMEEEADDQVLLPRSPLPQLNDRFARSGFSAQPPKLNISAARPVNDQEEPSPSTDWIAVERPDSVSELVSPYPRSGTASPVPKVPGYIPGMPRPMTPRETETDDLRSYSTTPRATAPVYDKSNTPMPIHAHDLLRQDSNASTTRLPLRSDSPSILSHSQRPGNGRYTPDSMTESSHTIESPTSNRRRPASPLSNNVYQPLITSRPSTPSNVTWNVRPKSPMQPNKQQAQSPSHTRDGSNYTFNEYDGSSMFALDRSKSITRSLRSPPLPDSPLIDGDAEKNDRSIDSQNELYFSSQILPSSIPKLELGSPATPDVRSPIPVLGSPISPLSSTMRYTDAGRTVSTPVSPAHLTTFPVQQSTPLVLSPASNSSTSSVVSAGSSYHSWNEEHATDGLGIGILGDLNEKEPAWHDFSDEEMSPPEKDPEAILRHFTGLTKYDLAAIQMKLFEATQNRPKNSESRTSTLRRRRPSTAQSIHSLGGRESRTTSPAPQSTVTTSFANSVDHTAKANALLNSVVDSIVDPFMDASVHITSPITDIEKDVQAPSGHQLNEYTSSGSPAESSPTRRNKDLADVLFGPSNKEQPILSVQPSELTANDTVDFQPVKHLLNNEETGNEAKESESLGMSALGSTSSNVSLRYPPLDQSQLAKLIQEKTEAAMAQLGKDSLRHAHSPPSRKKINPQDISSPRLVQTSTHVTPAASLSSSPIPTSMVALHENRQSSSKITSRMRKLRNTLRAKPQTTSGDELSPWMRESSTPDISRSHKNFSTPSPINLPPSDSSADLSKSRRVDGSSPAYASPTTKFGFMSRFRKRNQGDSPPELDRKLNSPYVRYPTPTVDSPPFSAPPFSRLQHTTADRSIHSPSIQSVDVYREAQTPSLSRSGTLSKQSPRIPDENALRQFFDAAENLGLDQAALNEFVATQSSNSRLTASTMRSADLIRQNSLKETAREPIPEASVLQASPSPERHLVVTPDPSLRTPILIVPSDDENSRAFSVSPDVQSNNTIVRRTLIFPSENGSNSDLTTLLSKVSKKGHRISTNSIMSGRSIHDRAPTPPPPRVKRFSTEPSPPVPKLPSSISAHGQSEMLSPSPFPASHSGRLNAYDSLYDMYSDTQTDRQITIESEEPNVDMNITPATPDPGQIVEVIEMANGETIWSIVNGLRDEDIESMSPRRISVASEYSVVPGDGDEQLFFKEHVRNTSKGSNVSFLSRKRNTQAINRPETKVFYSSSSQIARLIEQLSHNADAGSFNIKPKVSANHSHSSSFQSESDINWTVEERLERMLGSMQT